SARLPDRPKTPFRNSASNMPYGLEAYDNESTTVKTYLNGRLLLGHSSANDKSGCEPRRRVQWRASGSQRRPHLLRRFCERPGDPTIAATTNDSGAARCSADCFRLANTGQSGTACQHRDSWHEAVHSAAAAGI